MVLLSFVLLICFVKQKTAYWMLISDWSSDVCSSDLRDARQSKIAEIGPTFETTHSRSCSPLGLGHLRINLEKFFQPLGVIAESATDIEDRKSVVSGKRVSVRVDPGGRRVIKEKRMNKHSQIL